MDAQIWVSGGKEVGEFADLREWLRSERALTGAVQAVPRPPGEGELGGAVNVLAVALGSGGTGAVLARSLITWLKGRRSDVSITVMSEDRTVTVDARNLGSGDATSLLQEVLRGEDA